MSVVLTGKSWSNDTLDANWYSQGTVRSIAFDKKNNAWLATQDDGLVEVTTTSLNIFNHKNSHLPQDQLCGVVIDSIDDKWIATRNNGIGLFNENSITSGSFNSKRKINLNDFKGIKTISIKKTESGMSFSVPIQKSGCNTSKLHFVIWICKEKRLNISVQKAIFLV